MSSNFEKILVASCLQDPEILRRAQRSKLKPHHIEDKIGSYLYSAAVEIAKDSPVSKDILLEYVKIDRELDDKQRSFYLKTASDYFDVDISGAAFTLKKIGERVREKELAYTLRDSIDKILTNQEVDEVLEDLYMKVSSLKAVDDAYHIYDYWEDWTERKAERLEVESGSAKSVSIDLNLHPFKRYFKRGLQLQELTAIGGPTYAGKSVMLSNFIHLAVHPVNGLNVLYIFAENKKIQAASRLDAILMDRSYDSLFMDVLKDPRGDDLFKNAKNEGYGGLKIAKVTPNEFDVMTIKSIIEDCKAEGFEPDVIALDSPDHQIPLQKTHSHWQAKAAVYWENKALATKEDLIFICTLPMKPSSKKSEKVAAEDAAGSYDISRICDNLIFFNIQEDDRMLSRASVQVVKNRDGTVDEKIIHFKFTNSLRLVPWEDAMKQYEEEHEAGLEYKLSDPTSFESKFKRTSA